MFFCEVMGSGIDFAGTYLCFVPAVDNWQLKSCNDAIAHTLGTCLRLIECEGHSPGGIQKVCEKASPSNLQSQVCPLNHRVAEFIRDNPPLH